MLDTIHNAVTKLATGAFRFSPIASLLNIICNVIYLYIKRQEIAIILAVKLTRSKMVSSVQSFPFIQAIVNENDLNLINVTYSQMLIIPPWILLQNMIVFQLIDLIKNSISPHIYIQEFKNLLSQYSNFITIFTDVSQTESNVGSLL